MFKIAINDSVSKNIGSTDIKAIITSNRLLTETCREEDLFDHTNCMAWQKTVWIFRSKTSSVLLSTNNESTEIKETARFSSIISTGSPSHTSASQQFRLTGTEQALFPEAYDSSLWRADVVLSQDITGKFPPEFLTFQSLGFKVLSETKTLKFAP